MNADEVHKLQAEKLMDMAFSAMDEAATYIRTIEDPIMRKEMADQFVSRFAAEPEDIRDEAFYDIYNKDEETN